MIIFSSKKNLEKWKWFYFTEKETKHEEGEIFVTWLFGGRRGTKPFLFTPIINIFGFLKHFHMLWIFYLNCIIL